MSPSGSIRAHGSTPDPAATSSLTRVTIRTQQEKLGLAFASGVVVLKPLLLATTRPTWLDTEKFPVSGGCVVVMNHVSHVDPITACDFFYEHGRVPRFLAKSGLFRTRALGAFLRNAGQIPVERQSAQAASAFSAAVEAVGEGKCLVVYPEGTLTRDPDLWPMTGKSGAARIGLETQAPVIPIGQWGAQAWLPPYRKWPAPLPPKPITMKVGDPVDLEDLRELDRTPAVIRTATDRIMAAITGMVEDIRGESGSRAPLRHAQLRGPADRQSTQA